MFDVNMRARYFFFTFLLVGNRVSSQNVRLVKGTLGGSVILPCSTDQSNTNVYWRYGEKITVCDIITGKVDFDEQDPEYKDRVESFSSEFAKGNFSIKLKNLKKSDEGVYICNFPNIPTSGTLKLIVTENRIGIVMRGPYCLVLFLLGCILLL